MARAMRSRGERRWTEALVSGTLGDELVALGLDDPHARELAGRERLAASASALTRQRKAPARGRPAARPVPSCFAQVHDAVDLRGLARHAPLEGEGRVLGGAVHQDLHLAAEPLGAQLPGDAILA